MSGTTSTGQVLGIIEVSWLGNNINIKPGGTVKLGGLVNKPVKFGKQVGFAKMMEESEVKVKAVVTSGMVVTGTFNVGASGELQVQCDTGQIFVWDDGFITGAMTLTAGENSEIDVTWSGGAPLENAQTPGG